jgi:hypothetical protein
MMFSARRLPARRAAFGIAALIITVFAAESYAQDFDIIGLTVLRATTTNLNGAGVRVGQVEAQGAGDGDWEVTPGATGIGLPASNFTWYTTNASASTFPNSLGIDSGHADQVGGIFYGLPNGVSTNVSHIAVFEADDFFDTKIPMLLDPDTNARVISQSFVDPMVTDQNPYDQRYDDYSSKFHVLFVTGVGDGVAGADHNTQVLPPSTCYNGIGVSAYFNTNATSIGPTVDNGRAKPDITAPESPTSYSTPFVSGAAAVLMGAGVRGDGGVDTNSAVDTRTVKALLLNGAIKPAVWTNPAPSPLDPLYGAGILDVFESYRQLAGGKHGYTVTSNLVLNALHPPTGATGNLSSLVGWDFNAITNTTNTDAVNHYCFNVTNAGHSSPFTATITLVWNRQYTRSTINNLDLFLYNMGNSKLVAASASSVDNVEHIYVPQLPAGRYDLEVLKHGGGTITTTNESYALAFEFFAVQLTVTPVTGGVLLSWPAYPDKFRVQASRSASGQPWAYIGATPTITNGQNIVFAGTGIATEYFRLCRYP